MARKNGKGFDPMYIFPIIIGLTAIAVLVVMLVLAFQ
jgi:hypothetical protein